VVHKRYNGKTVTSRHPKYDKAKWYCWARVNGTAIHRKLNARTKEQAEKAAKELIDKLIAGETNERGFSDFVDDVYVRYIKGLKSSDTQEIFIPILKDFFKNKFLHKIKTQDCRDFRNKRLETPTKHDRRRSNASVNREMAAVSKVFSLAIEEGCIKSHPMAKLKRLRENEPRLRFLTDAQRNGFFRELEKDTYLKDVVTIGMNFPMRKGQILALRRRDVDLENRVLWVKDSKGKPPRGLYINDAVYETLDRLASLYPDDLFPMKYFQKRWQKLLLKAGINTKDGRREDNFHFHDLRTDLGTTMIRNGTHPRVVQKTFNHSNMTTSAIYMAVDFEQQKEALRGVGATNLATNFFDETAKTQ
jgi:integrase